MSYWLKLLLISAIVLASVFVIAKLIPLHSPENNSANPISNAQEVSKPQSPPFQQNSAQQNPRLPSEQTINIKEDIITCHKYGDLLKKFGDVQYTSTNTNYLRNSKGSLCQAAITKITYSPNTDDINKVIYSTLKNDGWEDTMMGGDLGGLDKSGSSSVYKKGTSYLIYESGFRRNDEAALKKCYDESDQGTLIQELTACIDKIKATVHFYILAGEQY